MLDDLVKENAAELLSAEWLAAKEEESSAINRRREIENHLVKLLNIDPSLDGTINHEFGNFQVKIVGRLDRKVNGDLVQELARDHDLSDHLSSLFRWKPELNMPAWKSASDLITNPLLSAITTKPGRPSFSITAKE